MTTYLLSCHGQSTCHAQLPTGKITPQIAEEFPPMRGPLRSLLIYIEDRDMGTLLAWITTTPEYAHCTSSLPSGSNSGWQTWKCLSRLRIVVTRTKSELKKCEFLDPTANTLCKCGLEKDRTNHRLKCHLLAESCSDINLAEFNERAKLCVIAKWKTSKWWKDSNTRVRLHTDIQICFQKVAHWQVE